MKNFLKKLKRSRKKLKDKFKDIPYEETVKFQRNSQFPYIYDLDLKNIQELKQFDIVECHVVLYPYSRKICSGNISFYPFEEYVKDILSHQRSAYAKINNPMNNIFGLFLGFVIALIFLRFKPDDLFSVESIVSVFGAYILGKELWNDIEDYFINISKKWRVRYRDEYYLYRLEKHTTLTHYSLLAKEHRYGKVSLLPEKIDFIEQSNSQTVRMGFNMNDLKSFEKNSAHILSIHIDEELLAEFKDGGFMLGIKLSLNKKLLGMTRCYEFFQSINGKRKGCLDEDGEWIDNAIFYRRTCIFGRIKCFLKKGLIKAGNLIMIDEKVSEEYQM
jgi:hypothetical protein